MQEFWQYLSGQWTLFTQQLTLEWDAIQTQPGGLTGEIVSWFLALGQWLRTGNRGVLVLLLAVIVFTRRFLRNR